MGEVISERDFEDIWGVYAKPSGNLFWYEDVRDHPLRHVWSVVEGENPDDNNWYAAPGFHLVNVLGYVMTKKPWTESIIEAIYFLDDFDDENKDDEGNDADSN